MMPLRYLEHGSGDPLLLLHGFCESSHIWDLVIESLSRNHRLVLPDLPGHGKSPFTHDIRSLDDVAKRVIALAKELKLDNPSIFGHSMGGYVTLAAIEQQPDYFKSFGLIHSTASADTPEKKANRDKSIRFIQTNGAGAFFNMFIPSLYHRGGPWVEDVERMVRQTPRETLISYSEMMRDRPDRTRILETFDGRILIIGGREDTFIPFQSLKMQADGIPAAELHLLEDIGHLAMFEDPERLVQIIEGFTKG